jgi:aryl-alcohol dehydrogenase-like predicted oxidoreductase
MQGFFVYTHTIHFMHYRRLGKTNYNVSEIGFGAWAIGGTWGKTNDDESLQALHTAADNGVNFFDTADVYGDGHSEKLIAQFLKERNDANIIVATKAGRRLSLHVAEGYTGKNIESFIERSLQNLQREALDLLQLHCPPTSVYSQVELFDYMDSLVKKGKIKHYGVSVETVEEALKALQYPGVSTVQIIFNIFRQKPAEVFFAKAKKHDVGIIARVPLASGMLSGKMTNTTIFEKDDHRTFNRNGEAFDKGETFSGVDYETGLKAVEELKGIVPNGYTLSQLALQWILSHPQVSTTIPGAKTKEQVILNTKASELPPLSKEVVQKVNAIYNKNIKPLVHNLW